MEAVDDEDVLAMAEDPYLRLGLAQSWNSGYKKHSKLTYWLAA